MSLAAEHEHGTSTGLAEAAFARLPLPVQAIGEAMVTLRVPEGWRLMYDHFPGLTAISPDGHYHRMMRPTEGGWFVSHPYEKAETRPTAQEALDTLVQRWEESRA